ncbi:MAG TPA: hypothetical protein VFR47_19460 [Anaerolineales bacterium]|nr:hypothetical protein [Anaerolineales bacterium]
MDKLSIWKEQIARLDAALRPVANRPVGCFGLLFKPRRWTHPLDVAGVRAQAEGFLSEVIEYYPTADADMRQAIRKLFEDHPSFTWAATLPYQPVTDEHFRAHLILFSIKDHEQDTRDAIVLLYEICEKAEAADIKIGPILKEIAELSSDVNKYGMGSTRSLLLNAVPKSPG